MVASSRGLSSRLLQRAAKAEAKVTYAREELSGLLDSLDESVAHEDIFRVLLKLYRELGE